jgi:hypothetical protein
MRGFSDVKAGLGKMADEAKVGLGQVAAEAEAGLAKAADDARVGAGKVAEYVKSRVSHARTLRRAKQQVAKRVQAYGDIILRMEMEAVENHDDTKAARGGGSSEEHDMDAFARCVAKMALRPHGGGKNAKSCCPASTSKFHFSVCDEYAERAMEAFAALRELMENDDDYHSYVKAYYGKDAIVYRRYMRNASATLVILLGALTALYATSAYTTAQKNKKTAELLSYLDIPADQVRSFVAEAEGAPPDVRKKMVKGLLRANRPPISVSDAYDFVSGMVRGGWEMGKRHAIAWLAGRKAA